MEELRVYELAMDLGEDVWNVVDRWNYFQKDTVGKQPMTNNKLPKS